MAGKEGVSVRRVLLKDQQARLLVGASTELASAHERDFADGVRLLLRYGSDASLGPNRATFWGPSAAPLAPGQDEVADLLPTWYAQANATCEHCAVPLVPGLTGAHVGKTLVYACRVCGARQRVAKQDKAAFSSVRSRRKVKKRILEGKGTAEAGHSAKASQREAAPVPTIDAAPLSLDPKAGKRKESASSPISAPMRAAAPPPKAPKLDRQGPSLASGRPSTSLPKAPSGQSTPKPARPGAGATATPTGARAPARKQAADPKAGLRALLQQKKQQEAKPKPSGGGLADFLSQL